MSSYRVSTGCFLLLYFVVGSFSSASAIGFFGYSPQAKKFLALCKGQVPQSDDSKRIIAKMRSMVGQGSCEQNWEQIKKLTAFDFHGMRLRDISSLGVIKHTKKIDLHNNLIIDLSPLNEIAELNELNLADNCLFSMQSLKPRPSITALAIVNNQLSQAELLKFASSFHHLSSNPSWFQQSEKSHCLPPGISLELNQPITAQRLSSHSSHLAPPHTAREQRQVNREIAAIPRVTTARVPAHHVNGNRIRRVQRGPVVVPQPAITTTSTTTTAVQIPLPPRPAPRPPPSPRSLEEIAAEQLATIKRYGLTFSTVISMDEIAKLSELKEALGELGLTNIDNDDIMRYLYQTKALFDEINPRSDFSQRPPSRSHTNARVNGRWLTQAVKGRSYTERLNELVSRQQFRDSFYLKFFHLLTAHADVFNKARYPQGETGSSRQKFSDLILLLTAIKQENTGSALRRCLSPEVCSHHRETFESSGQQAEWYVELRYKLFKLYKVYPSLAEDKKLDLLSYFLHGGSHCNDAKWHAINDAFARFCPEDALAIENEYSGGLSPTSLEGQLTKSLTKLKISELTSYINKYVDQENRNSEYCSTFNATWDALAPRLGLYQTGHRYQMENTNALHYFTRFLQEKFTPTAITRALQDDIKAFLRKYYLGPLMQLTPEIDKVVDKVLRFYQVIY